MKEIEVKAYLDDKEKVVESIKKLGVLLGETSVQEGTEYLKKDLSPEQYPETNIRIRVRTENGIHKFAVKQSSSFALSKIECETEIANRQIIEKSLDLLGYYPVMNINKKRQIAHFKEYEICIDEVEGLGSFIEIEKMSDEEEGGVIKELENFLFSLGVTPDRQIKKGYDMLLLEKILNK